MHCPYCGKEHPVDTKFCPDTGKSLKKRTAPKTISVSLSSPVILVALGVVIVLVILMAVFALQKSQQPILPVATQDVQGTLAAIVNLTAAAQITQPPQSTSTSTSTIPPTLTIVVVPNTPIPLPTRTPPAGAYYACPNAYPSVLKQGDVAMVSLDPPIENNLRDKPSTESPITGVLEPGEKVNLVGGPACMGYYVWWHVVSQSSGREGYTAEGDWNDYWLVKVE